jgi:hypothetical protein
MQAPSALRQGVISGLDASRLDLTDKLTTIHHISLFLENLKQCPFFGVQMQVQIKYYTFLN